MRIHRRILAFMTAVLAVGGCGGGSHHSPSNESVAASARTVDIEMRDIAYSPPTVPVRAGETVMFVFHNKGQAVHEAFLGDEAAQVEHEKAMQSADTGGMGGMGGAHPGEGDEIKIQPGKTGSLTHTFHPGESLLIGCHEPGHYQAGMKVALTVS